MEKISRDPFRLFFPLGVFFLLLGVLIWVPRIWDAENYPVVLHRVLVLNGFVTCFIGGFLFTAVPRFSQTEFATRGELLALVLTVAGGVASGWLDRETAAALFSSASAVVILFYLLRRIRKRKANPPYSFVFLFIGLILWITSGIGWALTGEESFKEFLYHGAVMAIILGVGSRLLPGIMGHSEIVSAQRQLYEKPVPLLKTIPPSFLLLMLGYVGSFFLAGPLDLVLSAAVVTVIALVWWKLSVLPREKTALTISLWVTAWLIVGSYILRATWPEGMIHGSHAFFINGLVLLSLLVATRVIQSHGPKDKSLENWKGLYWVTGLIAVSSATRVTAYLMPDHYLSHLGYASVLLILAVLLWSWKYFLRSRGHRGKSGRRRPPPLNLRPLPEENGL